MLRGGSWNNNARNTRAANRNRNSTDNRNNNVSFRPSRMLPARILRFMERGSAPASIQARQAMAAHARCLWPQGDTGRPVATFFAALLYDEAGLCFGRRRHEAL